jgi:hypothetical protein
MFILPNKNPLFSVISFDQAMSRLRCEEPDLYRLFDARKLQRATGLLISSRKRRMVYEAEVIALEKAGFADRAQAASETAPAISETK